MRKIAILAGLFLLAAPALATVTISTGPVSLVTTPITASSLSTPIGLISFTLGADASETLSSVGVTVANNGTSVASGTDLASVAVYRDNNANGTLEPATDLLAGTAATVNVGSLTTVATGANNSLPGTFLVALSTSASWGTATPADSVTVSLGTSGVATSANSPTVTAVTTNTISAIAATPTLSSAVATNSGGTATTEAGDSVLLTFGSATNKPTVNSGNVNTVLVLNNSHSWLDGALVLGSTTWNTAGTILTVTLSAGTSVPTVAVGDTVTVSGIVIKDVTGTNNATGVATITGSFSGSTGGEGDDDENENDDEGEGKACTNSLINGRLYKVADSATVYLAAHCLLKPFRGAAVFHARGHKFQNIIALSSLTGLTVSDQPALPASGTLVKGSDKTVWFVENGGKRKGFASAAAFLGLGFNFGQVSQISDSDLNTIGLDPTAIMDSTHHPDGALVKCTSSPTIAQVSGSTLVPFANVDSFTLRGHTFQQVATINCSVFRYVSTAPITQ